MILLLMLLTACSEPTDFNQADDLMLEPVVEASILYIESPEEVINESDFTSFTYDFNFDAFGEKFVSENLIDGMIAFELENTTSKPFTITLEFLDEGGNTLFTQVFELDAAPTAILYREVFFGTPSGQDINIIRNTSGFRVTADNEGDTSSVSSLPDPKIIFRSSAKFRLSIL
ncbi:hypothetical protein [Zeaxanthinibacter enoshimensis]|nr:hypothetical protein [Zeaxanthinibacter enoshimensis]